MSLYLDNAMARRREQSLDGFGKRLKLDNALAKVKVLRKKEGGKREPKNKMYGKDEGGAKQRRSARLKGGKPEDPPMIEERRSKKRREKLGHIVENGLKKRKREKKRSEEEEAVQVVRIHVGSGGEDQLREHLRGDGETVMQVEI